MMRKKKLLKTLRFGIEFELFTLDTKGFMIDGANLLIKKVKDKFPEVEIKKESGKNMIEITTLPNSEIPDAMLTALDHLEKVTSVALEEKMILYAYGTYPGSFTPEFQNKKRYKVQEKMLGKSRFLISGRCIGLHFHFSMPWGVFDLIKRDMKPLSNSKNMQSLIGLFNLSIAMDPALTSLAQSSPFYQGEKLGKDARVILYRGGNVLSYPKGLYGNLQKLGALQRYKLTYTDIEHITRSRFNDLKDIFKKIGADISLFVRYKSILDSAWNPVKISPHGTLEIRGLDMNHPDVVVALAVLLKFIFKEIQEKYLKIVPSDTAIEKPFQMEGDKILIPPDSYVINHLQPLAAYEGLSNPEIHKYCSALLQLGKKFIPEDRLPLLDPIETFLKNKQSASDRILSEAEKLFTSKAKLSKNQAAKLAVKLSKDFYDEIKITKTKLETLYRS